MLTSRSTDAKTGRKRLYIMLAELVLVLALMLFLLRLATNLGKTGSATGARANDPLAYHNDRFGFFLRAPDTTWKILAVQASDSLPAEEAFATLLEAAQFVVQMHKMQGDSLLASAEVGVLRPNPPRASHALAGLSFQQIQEHFQTTHDSALVIAPVTPVTSKIMDASFFVMELPNGATHTMPQLPVWVCTYVARREIVYVIVCKTRSEDYNRLREELEQVIAEFRVL